MKLRGLRENYGWLRSTALLSFIFVFTVVLAVGYFKTRPAEARGMITADGPKTLAVNARKDDDDEDRELQKSRREFTPEAIEKAQRGPAVKPVTQFYGESAPLAEIAARNTTRVPPDRGPLPEEHVERTFEVAEQPVKGPPAPAIDAFLQHEGSGPFLPIAGASFDGPGDGLPGYNVEGVPPDTTLAVGPNHIIAWVNSQFAIFDKSGNALLPGGFVNGNALFSGLGNVCETTNRGDPILQYDRMASRWVLSQFAFETSGGMATAPYMQCFAISTSPDPLGTYFRYSVNFDPVAPSGFNDYGKLGIWPDAFYTAYNIFGGAPAGNNTGVALCASDRTKMLAGQPASTLCSPITFYAGGGSFLPIDLDGATPPTNTSQGGIFARYSTGGVSLRLIKVKPDFTAGTVTVNDGFGGAAGSFINIPVGATTLPCNGSGGTCISQPGTATQLDTLGDRLMYRMAYRNRNGVDSLLIAHAVDPDGGGSRGAAMRWYEIRSPFSATPTLFQNSTYDPGGSGDRWMGSIAMDKDGNMMLGYSMANGQSGLKPSLGITGRLSTDPVNTMQTETIALTGTGSQTSATRWGDYTTMQVDPADDSTFWYIGQYLTNDGSFNWHTRVVSYKFTGGGGTPTPTATPSGTPAAGCDQNFDGVVAPALPAGWSSNASGAEVPWITSPVGSDTAPNNAFAAAAAAVGNTELISPAMMISAAGGSFTFRNNFDLESTFDGMVLEISINGGAYQDILAAGGSFLSGGYNGTISTGFMSPIAGRQAWTGNSGGYLTSNVNLPVAARGQSIRLKWRSASDSSVGATGVRIDTISGIPCATATPTPTNTPTNTPTATATVTATNTPTATATSTPGSCTENFDGVTAPALPSGWSSSATGGETAWVTSASGADTAPNSVFAPDPASIGNSELISIPIQVPGSLAVTFRNNFDTENTFDGMVLEISISGGAYQDILAAGGSFAAGGYTGTISASFMSPIAGRQAWTGTSNGYITTIVNLPGAAAGQSIRLKWRMASDSSVGANGARVDTISGLPCAGGTPTATPTNTPTATPTNTPPPGTRTAFDYDADGKADISIFRPSSGAWYLQRSRDGLYGAEFGYATDRIAPADYDGDRKADLTVYRPETNIWYVLNSSDGTVSYFNFGIAEDLPTPGDYDGDGKADISVFRPSSATWFRRNSSDGSFYARQFGLPADKPTVGDFDGDGKADIAIFRPSDGAWYEIYSSDGSFHGRQFGFASDVITPADYDGDRKTDIAVYRPSEGYWYLAYSSDGTVRYAVFGLPTDIPAPGDFDGDGKADISVFRPSDGTWYRTNSSNNMFVAYPFGASGDKPTQTAFRY